MKTKIYCRIFFLVILLIISTTTIAKLPIMNITFGGPLQKNCLFVDSKEVKDSLSAIIDTLNLIDEPDQACRNILINTKSYATSYANYLSTKNSELLTAKSNEKAILEEISSLENKGTYTGQYDSTLLDVKKDIRRLKDKDLNKSESLSKTLQLGSTVFEELVNNPVCNTSLINHIVAPSVSMMGSMFGSARSLETLLVGAGAQFIMSGISFFGNLFSDVHRSLRSMTSYSNYLRFKCVFKNIENTVCRVQEEEKYSNDINLDDLADRILDIDTTGEFKKLRDLIRNRVRISNLIDRLEKLYNSPETFNDLKEIVNHQTRVANIELFPKHPPFANKHYIEQMKSSGMEVIVDLPWVNWNHNIVKWSHWYNGIAHAKDPNDYLGNRIEVRCLKLKDDPDLSFIIQENNYPKCNPGGIEDVSLINKFIKLVIAPSLVDLQRELRRVNKKIQTNPSLSSLYSLIHSPKQKFGSGYDRITLKELIELFKEHTNSFEDSAVYFFARDLKNVFKSLSELVVSDRESFSSAAKRPM